MLRRTLSTLLFLSLFALGSIASAQNPPPPTGTPQTQEPMHKFMVEGALGLGMCTGDCDHIGPHLGLHLSGFTFLRPNIALGGTVAYQLLNPDYNDASLSLLQLSGEGRYYYTVAPKMKVFGLLGLGFGKMSFELGTGDSDDTYFLFQFGAGADYMIGPNITVGGVVSYQLNMWLGDFEDTVNPLYLGARLSFFF